MVSDLLDVNGRRCGRVLVVPLPTSLAAPSAPAITSVTRIGPRVMCVSVPSDRPPRLGGAEPKKANAPLIKTPRPFPGFTGPLTRTQVDSGISCKVQRRRRADWLTAVQ
jgi:hypothetical protein